jgi:hypothetical protein
MFVPVGSWIRSEYQTLLARATVVSVLDEAEFATPTPDRRLSVIFK